MKDDLVKSHIEWLRGDHERCNPFLADRIEAIESRAEKAEAERADLLEALQAMRDRREAMTHSPKDGGPAFPNSVQPDFQCAEAGMSLRDWFAGQALDRAEATKRDHIFRLRQILIAALDGHQGWQISARRELGRGHNG